MQSREEKQRKSKNKKQSKDRKLSKLTLNTQRLRVEIL